MDDTSRPPAGGAVADPRAAAEVLQADRPRARAARRLRLRDASAALDRLAELASRLLGAPTTQISLIDDVQVVVAGAGLRPGSVGTETPLQATACAITAADRAPLAVPDAYADPRVSGLAPVAAGAVGAYLGAPLVDGDGHTVGVLCAVAPAPRPWSETDVATLRELAGAAVTELELAALTTAYESDRLRWGLAVDAAGIGTFDWDLRTGELTWDARLIEMFGHTPETFGNSIEAFNERVHPDDLPRVTDALQASIETRGDYEAEYRVVWPGGDTRWLQARGRTLVDGDGRASRVIGAAYDTTAERAAGLRVTRVLEAMPAGFYSLDREWRFTHVNAEAERLLGRSREELLGQELWTAFPAAVGSVFEENYRTAVRTGTPVHFDAHYPAPLDGWYELRAWPSPEGLSVYFLEVTERRRVQDRAERGAQRLALLAQVSAELAGALDVRTATAHLPGLVVPALGDWCIVTVVDPDGRPATSGTGTPTPRPARWWSATPPCAPTPCRSRRRSCAPCSPASR